ncbi:hypothetical protein, partial [Pseudomonas syringae group genomosp. 3]|uniref:hypothetical protein n=1 Tax=Pseudomonas syringae group genomosp. 3 TaxID=251701 RepID=UPI001C7E5640
LWITGATFAHRFTASPSPRAVHFLLKSISHVLHLRVISAPRTGAEMAKPTSADAICESTKSPFWLDSAYRA